MQDLKSLMQAGLQHEAEEKSAELQVLQGRVSSLEKDVENEKVGWADYLIFSAP